MFIYCNKYLRHCNVTWHSPKYFGVKKTATLKYLGVAYTLLNVRIKHEHTAHSDCEVC